MFFADNRSPQFPFLALPPPGYNPGMRKPQRKSGVMFWATVTIAIALAVSVAYLLSIGPAVWILDHTSPPKWADDAFGLFYGRLFAEAYEPTILGAAIEWYMELWGWKPHPGNSGVTST